jgi:hypothetical protein
MTEVKTPYGDIFPTVGPCRDNYPNLKTFQNAAGQTMTLQAPAMRAFLEAERLNGRKLPWRKHRKPKAITVTGSIRSCADQTRLHNSDPGRFADPDSSRHPRGLAIDATNITTNLTRRAKAALVKVGFHLPRTDEPWHYSYFENG